MSVELVSGALFFNDTMYYTDTINSCFETESQIGREPSVSASRVLGLQVCAVTPNSLTLDLWIREKTRSSFECQAFSLSQEETLIITGKT